MPDLACLLEKVTALEEAAMLNAEERAKYRQMLEHNTALTTEVKQSVENLVELMKFFRFLRKAVIWISGFLVALGAIIKFGWDAYSFWKGGK